MMKILLPVVIVASMAEEAGLMSMIFGIFFSFFVAEFYLVAPYSVFSFFYFDSLGIGMVLLTLWISGLMLMVSGNSCDLCGLDYFYSLITLLCLTLVMAFMVSSMFFFYIFFEFSLVPITLMVLGWGYQPERLQASFYLVLYTVTASLPLLVTIFSLYCLSGHVSFYLLLWEELDFFMVEFWWGFLILAFLVKTPLYFFHLWLPKAHVESPLVGSMILAGVLLKLGGYGFMRALFFFQSIGCSDFWDNLGIVAIWGGVVCGMICMRQVDIKSLIAYSSVTHMGVMLGGLVSGSMLGSYGAFITMLAHGLVSSSMFLGAYMMYKIVGTRSLYLIKGMSSVVPIMSLLWFISLASNMGAPPSINLAGEVLLGAGILKISVAFLPSLGLSLFVSAGYSLFLYASTQNGGIHESVHSYTSVLISDCVAMFLHLFPAYSVLLVSGIVFVWV